jgi:hypothetical protein
MDIKMYIDAIETLYLEIPAAIPGERIKIYTAIKQLIDDVSVYVFECKQEKEIIDCNNSNLYFTELLSHIRPLTGLEVNKHPEEQQLAWIRSSIMKLRSVHCFAL